MKRKTTALISLCDNAANLQICLSEMKKKHNSFSHDAANIYMSPERCKNLTEILSRELRAIKYVLTRVKFSLSFCKSFPIWTHFLF